MCWLQQSAALWHYPTFLLPPLLLVACLECFAGYRAWRFLLGLNGAILGFLAGVFIALLSGAPFFVFIGAISGAIAGAALFIGILPLGASVFAFASAASFIVVVGRILGSPPVCYWPLACIAGFASTMAALSPGRGFIMALTAFGGAHQIACAWSAYHLPYDTIPVPNRLIPSECLGFLLCAAAGLFVQLITSARECPGQPYHQPNHA